ncbi:uncharacterized protein METZ01_LOCUS442422, partial [marine metagenome]
PPHGVREGDMQEENTISTSETGLNLKELFEVVWKAKSLVVLISLIFFAYSVYYIKSLPDSYSAYGTYVPSSNSAQASVSSGTLSGMAKMAGLNIPVAANNKVDLALDILRSRKFLRDMIFQKEILPHLGWDWSAEDIEKMSEEEKEELLQSATAALNGTFQIIKPRASSTVRIIVNHGNPLFAKQLVEWLIEGVNKTMADDAVVEAQKSIEYLKIQANSTSVTDLKTLFYAMIGKHVSTIMLAEVNKEYIFKTLDPPVLP